jgi:hypothetical protein
VTHTVYTILVWYVGFRIGNLIENWITLKVEEWLRARKQIHDFGEHIYTRTCPECGKPEFKFKDEPKMKWLHAGMPIGNNPHDTQAD